MIMDQILVSGGFPVADFAAFMGAAHRYVNKTDIYEDAADFLGSWQAVRFRYRAAIESANDLKTLLLSGDLPTMLTIDERVYQVERRIATFFASGLSVFDSLAYCLYFFGKEFAPQEFPLVSTPYKIDLKSTQTSYCNAFAAKTITAELVALTTKPDYLELQRTRNVLLHRLAGQLMFARPANGDRNSVLELWNIRGASTVTIGPEMLGDRVSKIAMLLTPIVSAAKTFAETV